MAAMASAEEHAQQEPTMMSEEELIELREVFKTVRETRARAPRETERDSLRRRDHPTVRQRW
jgi:hypothetical protein